MLVRLALASTLFGALAVAANSPFQTAPKQAASKQTAGGPDGRFDIDASHSTVMFKIRHLGASNFYGRFNDVGGKLLVDADDPTQSLINLTIKVASVDTHDAGREKHLKSADFFNAEEFPTIEFESEKVAAKGAGKLEIAGTLKMHGVEKQITVAAEQVGYAANVGQFGTRVGYEAKFTVKRSDFGMKYMPDLLGDDVEILISLEGMKK